VIGQIPRKRFFFADGDSRAVFWVFVGAELWKVVVEPPNRQGATSLK
jgi:hypothetical protein